jgi:trimethylamine--corrinoid protein Co-methyltransferase
VNNRINFLEVFTAGQVEQIHTAALQIIEEIGIVLPQRDILEYLDHAGASVDFDSQLVCIPAQVVENSIRQAPSRFTLYARKPDKCLDINGIDTYFSGPNAAINIIDLAGERRPATVEDGEKFAKLVDVLPNYDISTGGVYPPGLADIQLEVWSYMVSLIHSTKPILAASTSRECAQTIIRMAEVAADCSQLTADQLPLIAIVNTTSPLFNTPRELDAFLEYIRHGVPIIIAPETQAGATGPATLAGTFVLHTAEFLAHATVAQLINPGVPIVYGTVASVFDMRKTILPYGAPEADLFNIATAQMARRYGIPSRGTGGTADANALGMQAGVESLMSILSCHLAGITYVNHAGGELENSLAASYEKTIIDDEIIAMSKRLVRGIDVTPASVALDVVKEVGPRGDFLSHEHTLKNFRQEQYIPEIWDRDRFGRWEESGKKRVEERAHDRVDDLLTKYEPEPLPREALNEISKIYNAIRR